MPRLDNTSVAKAVRILIVDDHPVVRDGLTAQLQSEPDLVVCGAAEDVPSAMAVLDSTRPDVAIIDISLKTGSGLDLIRRIRDRGLSFPILVWSMYPEELYAERALRAGAQGYVHKGQATAEILDAVRAVLAGKVYLSSGQSYRLLRRLASGMSIAHSPMESLSDRELEAFELIGQGRTTEEIATQMRVSPKTIETYRARIKDKLNLTNMTQLVQRATQWALEKK
jgi:DNA-binding NarL/FixJ family response regulator